MLKNGIHKKIAEGSHVFASDNLVSNPVVSVMLLSYNAGQFIKQALEGILSQNDYYTFEVIVSDDCSDDNLTAQALAPLTSIYPGRVKVIRSKWNLGPDSGMCNFVRTLKEARGKYVAICEADDFWCDNNKLKDLISFLENNPEYVCSFTQANVENHGTILGC